MSDAKNLCENSRVIAIKATEKLHAHHVPAAILGETQAGVDMDSNSVWESNVSSGQSPHL